MRLYLCQYIDSTFEDFIKFMLRNCPMSFHFDLIFVLIKIIVFKQIRAFMNDMLNT